ncbi:hypothetical protein HZ326_0321 [Fusarium oxysporum f. sp. albedinis]|nr:hypothetical protein HZ326_0321 [Fusarium oxysporum f. sp. albedinis]
MPIPKSAFSQQSGTTEASPRLDVSECLVAIALEIAMYVKRSQHISLVGLPSSAIKDQSHHNKSQASTYQVMFIVLYSYFWK